MVYIASIEQLTEGVSPTKEQLGPYYNEKVCDRRGTKRYHETLAGALLLRQALLAESYPPLPALPIAETGKGKPVLAPGDFFFSISHSGDYVACGLSDTPIGVDLEQLQAIRSPIARKLCHPQEIAQLQTAERPEELLLASWVVKESYSKMTGDGLTVSLTSLPVWVADGQPVSSREDIELTLFRPEGGVPMLLCVCREKTDRPRPPMKMIPIESRPPA